MRLGTVDDFHLHETKLRPRTEIFVEGRVGWWGGIEGAGRFVGGSKGPRVAGEAVEGAASPGAR